MYPSNLSISPCPFSVFQQVATVQDRAKDATYRGDRRPDSVVQKVMTGQVDPLWT